MCFHKLAFSLYYVCYSCPQRLCFRFLERQATGFSVFFSSGLTDYLCPIKMETQNNNLRTFQTQTFNCLHTFCELYTGLTTFNKDID